MLFDVLIGVTPITLLCAGIVLVPTRLFLDPPWSWKRAALVSSGVAAFVAFGAFAILARIFVEAVGPDTGLTAAAFAAVQTLLLVWLLAAASRLLG